MSGLRKTIQVTTREGAQPFDVPAESADSFVEHIASYLYGRQGDGTHHEWIVVSGEREARGA